MSKDTKNSAPKPGRLPSPPKREGNSVVRSLLDSRLGELNASKNQEAFLVALDKLKPNPDQPRQVYDPAQEEELAASVKQYGVLEPILVRKVEGGNYQIVAGERRFRAARTAGLDQVPVIVKEFSEQDAKFVSVVENLQRSDLSKEDEARYFQFLMNNFNFSGEQIASLVHRSPGYVSQRLKLLSSVSRETVVLDENNSEINHNDSQRKSLQQNSQSFTGKSTRVNSSRFTRKLVSFSSFLNEAREQLPAIEQEDKAALGEQLKELRSRIEELEKLLEQ